MSFRSIALPVFVKGVSFLAVFVVLFVMAVCLAFFFVMCTLTLLPNYIQSITRNIMHDLLIENPAVFGWIVTKTKADNLPQLLWT